MIAIGTFLRAKRVDAMWVLYGSSTRMSTMTRPPMNAACAGGRSVHKRPGSMDRDGDSHTVPELSFAFGNIFRVTRPPGREVGSVIWSRLARRDPHCNWNEELPERYAGYRSAFTASWIWRRATSRAPGGRPMNVCRPSGQTKRCSAIASFVKKRPSRHKFWLALVIALGALCAETGHAWAGYLQTNLVSDVPGLATITDPRLVNPWGMSESPTGSPFWTLNQGTNSATLYAVTGTTTVSQVLAVNAQGFVGIPTTAT